MPLSSCSHFISAVAHWGHGLCCCQSLLPVMSPVAHAPSAAAWNLGMYRIVQPKLVVAFSHFASNVLKQLLLQCCVGSTLLVAVH